MHLRFSFSRHRTHTPTGVFSSLFLALKNSVIHGMQPRSLKSTITCFRSRRENVMPYNKPTVRPLYASLMEGQQGKTWRNAIKRSRKTRDRTGYRIFKGLKQLKNNRLICISVGHIFRIKWAWFKVIHVSRWK